MYRTPERGLLNQQPHPAGFPLLSSDLESDELTRRILARINLIQFGEADVLTTRVNYSFDFLPYT